MITRRHSAPMLLLVSLALGAASLGKDDELPETINHPWPEWLTRQVHSAPLGGLRQAGFLVSAVNERTWALMDEAGISLEGLIRTGERHLLGAGIEVWDRDDFPANGIAAVPTPEEPPDGFAIVGLDLEMLAVKEPEQYVYHLSLGVIREVSIEEANVRATFSTVWRTECLDIAPARAAPIKISRSLRELLKELEGDWLVANPKE